MRNKLTFPREDLVDVLLLDFLVQVESSHAIGWHDLHSGSLVEVVHFGLLVLAPVRVDFVYFLH